MFLKNFEIVFVGGWSNLGRDRRKDSKQRLKMNLGTSSTAQLPPPCEKISGEPFVTCLERKQQHKDLTRASCDSFAHLPPRRSLHSPEHEQHRCCCAPPCLLQSPNEENRKLYPQSQWPSNSPLQKGVPRGGSQMPQDNHLDGSQAVSQKGHSWTLMRIGRPGFVMLGSVRVREGRQRRVWDWERSAFS